MEISRKDESDGFVNRFYMTNLGIGGRAIARILRGIRGVTNVRVRSFLERPCYEYVYFQLYGVDFVVSQPPNVYEQFCFEPVNKDLPAPDLKVVMDTFEERKHPISAKVIFVMGHWPMSFYFSWFVALAKTGKPMTLLLVIMGLHLAWYYYELR